MADTTPAKATAAKAKADDAVKDEAIAAAQSTAPGNDTIVAKAAGEPVVKVEDLRDPDLLTAAQAKAPHLDRAFLKEHGLGDEYLAAVARGEEPPPPYTGPDPVVDLHLTPGGWQITPKGMKPEDVGRDAISR